MKKFIAELIGTFTLVLLGCGTAVVAGDQVGVLGIAFAFGFALLAMAYGIGPVSGCHINPAVSIGVFVSGRMKAGEMVIYIIAQCIGAVLAAAVIYFIASGKAGYDIAASGLAQNGWGAGMFGEYSLGAAIAFELIATFLFVVVILGSTQEGVPAQIAG
ncbi:MAG: aquaporin, partial [Planctomycetota bacterium]